ncbi:MAG: hypothetical protein JJU45_06445 [Acidimicrobiia bacterium]|nr:hypothetical protein [Acidimicrobiia bacterium]
MLSDAQVKHLNDLIAYHSRISRDMTVRRTSYDSQLIPVSAYILVACAESYRRWPDMVRQITAAMDPAEIARHGHRPGSRVNPVHLWSLANFWLIGRKAVCGLDPTLDDPDGAAVVLDFWERLARSYRHDDGSLQAVDVGEVVRPYGPEVLDEVLAGCVPVPDDEMASVRAFTATVVSYLFLLWFDTRVGTADSGPYPLPDGSTLVVRDLHKLGRSEFWWSDVAADVPYDNLVAAYVLDPTVSVQVTDWGSTFTRPEDYLAHVRRFGLFEVVGPDRRLRPVGADDRQALVATLRKVQAAHYRNIVAMSEDERIRCGASVYFGFLRPFAEVAGVVDALDWTVPLAVEPPLYELLVAVGRQNIQLDPVAEFYDPLPTS